MVYFSSWIFLLGLFPHFHAFGPPMNVIVKTKLEKASAVLYGIGTITGDGKFKSLEITTIGVSRFREQKENIANKHVASFTNCNFYYAVRPADPFNYKEFDIAKNKLKWIRSRTLQDPVPQIAGGSIVLNFVQEDEVVVVFKEGGTTQIGTGNVVTGHGNLWVLNIGEVFAINDIVTDETLKSKLTATPITFGFVTPPFKLQEFNAALGNQITWNQGNHFVKSKNGQIECLIGVPQGPQAQAVVKFTLTDRDFFGHATIEIDEENNWILKIVKICSASNTSGTPETSIDDIWSWDLTTFGARLEFSIIGDIPFKFQIVSAREAMKSNCVEGLLLPKSTNQNPVWCYDALEVKFTLGVEVSVKRTETTQVLKMQVFLNTRQKTIAIIGSDGIQTLKDNLRRSNTFVVMIPDGTEKFKTVEMSISVAIQSKKVLEVSKIQTGIRDLEICEIYKYNEVGTMKIWIAAIDSDVHPVFGLGIINRIPGSDSWIVTITHTRRTTHPASYPVSYSDLTEFSTIFKVIELCSIPMGREQEYDQLTDENYRQNRIWNPMNVESVKWVSLPTEVNKLINLTCRLGVVGVEPYSLTSMDGTTTVFNAFIIKKNELTVDLGKPDLNQEELFTAGEEGRTEWRLVDKKLNAVTNVCLTYTGQVNKDQIIFDGSIGTFPYSIIQHKIEKEDAIIQAEIPKKVTRLFDCYIEFKKENKTIYGRGQFQFNISPEESGIVWIQIFGKNKIKVENENDIKEIRDQGWNWKLVKPNDLNKRPRVFPKWAAISVLDLPTFDEANKNVTAKFSLGQLVLVELENRTGQQQLIPLYVNNDKNVLSMINGNYKQYAAELPKNKILELKEATPSDKRNNSLQETLATVPPVNRQTSGKIKITKQIICGFEDASNFTVIQFLFSNVTP